jgi:transglutaminase-like putative cysteine protease
MALLQVTHDTRYDYDGRVEQAQHRAHLRPVDTPWQRVAHFALTIEPAPLRVVDTRDAFGNIASSFALETPHDSLLVRAQSRVEVRARPQPEPAGMPWERLRERLAYRAGQPYERASEFVYASPYVARHADLADYGRASLQPGVPVGDAAWDLMLRIHRDFKYQTASTSVNTQALEALHARRGVCQDFAHVMIGALRAHGLAARYVSGYLLTRPPPGRPRLVGADASHAWVSVYLGDGVWREYDPTNQRAPGEDYVTVAYGRDYLDVAPLRGVIRGSGEHRLTVAVTVEPLG